MRKPTKVTAVAAGTALAVVTAGTAYAYWTTTGSGSGSGSAAGTAGTLTLSSPTPVVGGLVPGSSITVPITAANSSTTTSLQATTLTVSNLKTGVAACDGLVAGAVATATATSPSSPVTVAPSSSASFGTVTIALPNSATVDQSSCKGATYTFDVAAS